MRYNATALLVVSLIAGSSASALARPAITTFNANLRSAPGVESPGIGIVPAQAVVSVRNCRGSWCRVDWNGMEGYIAASLIAYAPRNVVIAQAAQPDLQVAPAVQVTPPAVAYDEYAQCAPFGICASAGYIDPYANAAPAYDYAGYNGDYYDGVGIGLFGAYAGDGYNRSYGYNPYYGYNGGRFAAGAGYWPSGNAIVARRAFTARGDVANMGMTPHRAGFAANHVAANHVNVGRMGGGRSMSHGR